MLYLKQTFDIEPASPATLDRFVDLAESRQIASYEEHGASLRGAWFAHEEWFSQVVQVWALEDFTAFDRLRRAWHDDREAAAVEAAADAMIVGRDHSLLEPLGPIPAQRLDDAVAASKNDPAGNHSFAILRVNQGMMDQFTALLEGGKDVLPIIGAWRSVTGNPYEVIDLWRGSPAQRPYRPSDDTTDQAFFAPLRKLAPRERIMTLWPLPYSPLR